MALIHVKLDLIKSLLPSAESSDKWEDEFYDFVVDMKIAYELSAPDKYALMLLAHSVLRKHLFLAASREHRSHREKNLAIFLRVSANRDFLIRYVRL